MEHEQTWRPCWRLPYSGGTSFASCRGSSASWGTHGWSTKRLSNEVSKRGGEQYETWALSGMTVNERLYALGTLDAFERARADGDKRTVERLLGEARVDAESIRAIVRTL